MDDFLGGLYRRLRAGYILVPLAIGVVAGEMNIVLVTGVGCLGVLGLSADVTLDIMRGGLVAGTVGYAIASVSLVTVLPVAQWMTGRRDERLATRAWDCLTRGLKRVVAFYLVVVTIAVLPTGRAAARAAHLTTLGTILVVVVPVIVNATVAVLIVAIIENWAHPVAREISAFLPTDFEPEGRPSSLTRRILPTLLLFTFQSAFFAMGVVRFAHSVQGRVLTAMAAAASVSLLALAFGYALVRSLTSPINALIRATRDVREGILDTRVPPVGNDEAGELTRSFNAMVAGLRERAALHAALGTYVDPVVADRMVRDGALIEGESREVTVMFVDIVGFVSRSEKMRPDEVVGELNEFFELIVPAIAEHGGHTNKLLGDGLMAVFGAPRDLTDHADGAIASACAIRDLIRQRYGNELSVGIGINSGDVVVGTTGGGGKLDYTVYGDTVNVASRIEAMTRATGDEILITDATRMLLRRPARLGDRGAVDVRGRSEPLRLYGVLDDV